MRAAGRTGSSKIDVRSVCRRFFDVAVRAADNREAEKKKRETDAGYDAAVKLKEREKKAAQRAAKKARGLP